jgi:hypothetical protein
MTILTLRASGAADPGEAWDRYVVPARWPEWAPQISRVESSADRLEAGVTGRVFGPLGVYADFAVETVDEDVRRWAWSVRRGPLRLHLEHRVVARARGCMTSLSVDAPLPVALGYAPLAQFALHRLVAH